MDGKPERATVETPVHPPQKKAEPYFKKKTRRTGNKGEFFRS